VKRRKFQQRGSPAKRKLQQREALAKRRFVKKRKKF
jgi:hypothetical protein